MEFGQSKKASFVAVLGNSSMISAMSATVVPGVNPGKTPGINMFQPWPLGGNYKSKHTIVCIQSVIYIV